MLGELGKERGPPFFKRRELGPELFQLAVDLLQLGPCAKFTEPPLLVVEIRSPSTALIDLNRKKAAYEGFGVPSYWIVNPDPPSRS